ncbi:hypothetical protein [Pseudochryseolinea flava]|uniref:Uncharacterized protein n=1 Tax=Pseudochryseolinea flava TaxID=2059302 RepID=A0A364Y729_9BACT|nr:hypothetical protein [Pseudochryseolinea flava]RAW02914.1 hypothetical protein DQQ10_02055 [Pseudochryseolinea flava]
MIASIKHSELKNLFDKGTSRGLSATLKKSLLLWLSIMHAAKDLGDVTISKVSTLEEDGESYRLYVQGLGTFSFQFVDGEIRRLNYRQDLK